MNYQQLMYEQDEHGVATVTLNRPERLNAIGTRLAFELIDVLERVEEDESAKVVVFTGAGRAFCSGADQSGQGDPDADELTESYGYRRAKMRPFGHWGVLFEKLGHYQKPTIAATVNSIPKWNGSGSENTAARPTLLKLTIPMSAATM